MKFSMFNIVVIALLILIVIVMFINMNKKVECYAIRKGTKISSATDAILRKSSSSGTSSTAGKSANKKTK